MKVKSINAYIQKNGKKIACIKLDNGEVIFINEGLVAYAFQHAVPVKDKDSK